MPGKHTKQNEPPLSRAASLLATECLKGAIDLTAQTKLKHEDKEQLVQEVNQRFFSDALADVYTVRKLETWFSNALYKFRCAARNRKPDSWKKGQRLIRRHRQKRQSTCKKEVDTTFRSDCCGGTPVESTASGEESCVGAPVEWSSPSGGEQWTAEEEGRAEALSSFLCPISKEVMRDPVLACDGHSYERRNIERWLREKTTSPLTGAQLDLLILIPNHTLRMSIREYVEKHGMAEQEEELAPAAGGADTTSDGHYFVFPEATAGASASAGGTPPPCAVAMAAEEAESACSGSSGSQNYKLERSEVKPQTEGQLKVATGAAAASIGASTATATKGPTEYPRQSSAWSPKSPPISPPVALTQILPVLTNEKMSSGRSGGVTPRNCLTPEEWQAAAGLKLEEEEDVIMNDLQSTSSLMSCSSYSYEADGDELALLLLADFDDGSFDELPGGLQLPPMMSPTPHTAWGRGLALPSELVS